MTDRSAGVDCLSVEAEVTGITDDGHIDLRIVRGTGCESCSGLCQWQRAGMLRLRPDARSEMMRDGTRVLVTLPADIALRSALLLHGVPLGGLLAGAALGTLVVAGDLGSLVGAVLGLAAGLAAAAALRGALERRAARELGIRILE